MRDGTVHLSLTPLQVTILLLLRLLLDVAGAQPIGGHLSKPLDVCQAVVQRAAGCLAASYRGNNPRRRLAAWSRAQQARCSWQLGITSALRDREHMLTLPWPPGHSAPLGFREKFRSTVQVAFQSEPHWALELSQGDLLKAWLSISTKKVTSPPRAFSFIKMEKDSYFLMWSMQGITRNDKQILFQCKEGSRNAKLHCNPFDSAQRIDLPRAKADYFILLLNNPSMASHCLMGNTWSGPCLPI